MSQSAKTVTVPATGERFDLGRPGAIAAWNRSLNRHYGMENLSAHPSRLVRRIEARRRARIDALVGRRPFQRAVDLGAEDGSLPAEWSRHGRIVFLIDVDISRLVTSNSRAIGADASKLPLQSGACDLVVMSAILEHVPDPHATVAEAAREAGPGGRIVLYVPWDGAVVRAKRWARRFGFRLGKLHSDVAPGHLHCFDRASLRALLAPVSRRFDIRLDPWSFGWYAEAEIGA